MNDKENHKPKHDLNIYDVRKSQQPYPERKCSVKEPHDFLLHALGKIDITQKIFFCFLL